MKKRKFKESKRLKSKGKPTKPERLVRFSE
jgi:hypothetical protein